MKQELLKFNKLRTKFASLAGGIVFIVVFFSALNIFFIDRISRSSELVEKVDHLSAKLAKLEFSEKGFLLYSKAKSLSSERRTLTKHDQFNTVFIDISNRISSLQDEYEDYEGFRKALDDFNKNFEDYKILFNNMYFLLLERGDGQSGSIEKLNSSLLDLNIFVQSNFENELLQKHIGELIIIAENYLQTTDLKYRDDFNLKIKTLRSLVNVATGTVNDTLLISNSDYDKETIISSFEAIERSEKLFNNLTETDIAIGNSKGKGAESSLATTRINLDEISLRLNKISHEITLSSTAKAKWIVAILNIIFIILISLIFLLVSKGISKPFNLIRSHLLQLGKGNLSKNMELDFNDERGEMISAINVLTDNLRNTKEFVTEVGKGNFESEVNVFDNKGDLGASLDEMRSELHKIAKEREKQEQEDEKRNWITQGIAHFNDILRQNTDSIEELSYKVLKTLVEYLNAVQGALFVINDDDKSNSFLELKAAFAYDRRKFIDKKIQIGEGLAGRSVQEKSVVHLTEIPGDFFEITSGLGSTKPKALLVTPLKLNDDIFGVIEVAGLKDFEDYHIEFAKKISETVASAISSMKISIQTTKLLTESKIVAEELATKEEQMRQNMEELQATQEEAARKEAEAIGFVNSVNHSTIRADYNIDGKLEYANTKFLMLMGYASKEIKDINVMNFIDPSNLDTFKEEWNRVISGGKHIEKEMRYKTKDGNRWFLATYTPIKGMDGTVLRILYLAIDIDEQKAININYQSEITAIERSVIKAEYTTDGAVLDVNDMFSGNLGYSIAELKERDVFSFIRSQDLNKFQRSWKRIARGMPYEGTLCMITSNKELVWLRGTFSSVKDLDNNITKIIYIAYDITTQKINEEENKKLLDKANKLTDELSEQEEQMKINIEEMRTVQEEMARKDLVMSGQLDAIGSTSALVEYDLDGTITDVNEIFCELFGYVSSDIIGRNHRLFVEKSYRSSHEYNDFWDDLVRGQNHAGIYIRNRHDGTTIYLKGTYTPIFDTDDKVYKIMSLWFDITEAKLHEAEIKGQLEAINRTNLLIEFDPDGTIINANDIFCELYGYNQQEIIGRHHRMFVRPEDKKTDDYKEFWMNLINGHSHQGEFVRLGKNGKIIHLRATYFPVTNAEGKVYKIIKLAFDISEMKNHQEQLHRQTEKLESQKTIMVKNVEELKNSIELASRREEELNEMTEELRASEEELRQNLEEIQATQEEMERKQIEIEEINKAMEENEKKMKETLISAQKREDKLQKELQEKEKEIKKLKNK